MGFKIGFDLDGVIATPLFDGLLIKLRIFKEKILKSLGNKDNYFYPATYIERQAWLFLNKMRKPNCPKYVIESSKTYGGSIYLITSRFKFLEKDTLLWLEKYSLHQVFDGIYLNNQDINPTDFKSSVLNDNSIDYYLDDDWEVLQDLESRVRTKLFCLSGKRAAIKGISGTVTSVEEFILNITALTKLEDNINFLEPRMST